MFALPISNDVHMSSYLFTALPEMVLRNRPHLIPWIYENFINVYADGDGNLNYAGLSFSSTLAKAPPFLVNELHPILKPGVPFDIISYCRRQITEAKNYIYVRLDESQLKVMPTFGKDRYIHDSLLYGYDETTDEFLAIAQVDLHRKAVRYGARELEIAYQSAYNSWAYMANLVAFRLTDYHLQPYEFSLGRFLSQLRDYVNSTQDSSINYFCGPNARGSLYGQQAINRFLDRADANLPIGFGFYRNVHFITEHRKGLLQRFEFIKTLFCLPPAFDDCIEEYRVLVDQYENVRLLALKHYVSKRKGYGTRIKNRLQELCLKESDLLWTVCTLLRHGYRRDHMFDGVDQSDYTTTFTDESSDGTNFAYQTKIKISFIKPRNVQTLRVTERGSIALYDGTELVDRIVASDVPGKLKTFCFATREVKELTLVVSSDIPINSDNMRVEIGKVDLARNKKAYATSYWEYPSEPKRYVPTNVTNDDLTSFWSAARGWKPGETLVVDLGENQTVSQIRLTERCDCGRIDCFSVFCTDEAGNRVCVLERHQGMWNFAPVVHNFSPISVRYIEIVILRTVADDAGYDEPGLARIEVYD